MKVVISQSNYIPWRGFIDLISQADIYVVFDSMQFTKNDWRNRNLIRNRNSIQWLSIPCGQSISRSIDEVFPVKSNWFIKHAETIRHCYSNAPYWSVYGKILLDHYKLLASMSLSQLNIELLKLALEFNKSETSIVRDNELFSKEYLLKTEKSKRLVEICLELNASTYITAPAAKNYLNIDIFEEANISVDFFKYPQYSGISSELPELSWVDSLLMNGTILPMLNDKA
ncbi:WbqC family protein [Synechococcus sp. AH-736-M20]|nr:WbqC family protein [Synechococcus sp. AH-736-M20]